ncbi:hypothetical protein EHQ61_17230 [Leptospira wolffii]|uniref:metallophosphoesterase n=1 Tax=Leptospira wolffii TaxID=409998 RepID=UPI00108461B6|nr:metallophosphoesterase [Leptospira wolffii]TGL46490.1 hypothetical protein EHQ61_17230 [Leptospira wolffii]
MTNDSTEIRIALVGDIHGFWTMVDTEYFGRSSYGSIFFTGDLGNNRPGNANRIAKEIAKIPKPKYLIPGNHDSTSFFQLAVELFGFSPKLGNLSFPLHFLRWKKFLHDLGDIRVCRYNLFSESSDYSLLGARPLSMGGRLNFIPFLKYFHGIGTMEESSQRLLSLLEDSDSQKDLLVLAHNGPSGLGARAKDIWGCDFRKEEGDFGDGDLGDFILESVLRNRAPKVVVAGHMHHSSRKGKQKTRVWKKRKDGILYVNPARVPRIFTDPNGNIWHHHVALVRRNGIWDADAIFLKNGREEVFPLPEFLEREKASVQEE